MPVPVGSPPWIMNPGMIRWKITPVYRGPVWVAPVLGCFHSMAPVAKPSKFSTVFGACNPNRFTLIAPWLVCSVATEVGFVIAPLWQIKLRVSMARLKRAERTS